MYNRDILVPIIVGPSIVVPRNIASSKPLILVVVGNRLVECTILVLKLGTRENVK